MRAEEIRALDRNIVPDLLRRLLYAEAESNSIPLDRIRVGYNVDAPDGGIDAEIEWDGGPERTEFIQGRRVGYQVKTSPMTPTKARREVLDKEGSLKPAIRRLLQEERGHYVLVCSHPITPDRIRAMEDKLRETMREAGVAADDDRIHVLDGDQMAQWASRYGGVALWAKEGAAPGLAEPFLSWDAWSDRPEHTRPEWVEDGRLQPIGRGLRETIGRPRGLMRIVGPAGIGKSRLTLKALEEPESARLGVMYANEAWTSAETLRAAVRRLALGGLRATVVIDECRGETHELLTGEAVLAGSRLSLITIGDGSGAGARDHRVIEVGDAPADVVEGIVRQLVPESAREDRRRLAWLCEGSPELAVRGARAWFEGDLQGAWTKDDLFGALAGGQDKAARLLAAFGRIKVRDDPWEADRLGIDLDAGEARTDVPSDRHLEQVAGFGSPMTADELREGLEDLRARGLARRRGRYLSLEPRAIALPLAAKQWEAWSQSRWDRVLWGNDMVSELRESAARQLALLNRQGVAREVTRHACRLGSPLDRSQRPLDGTQAEVLHALSRIDAWSVAEQIGRVLDRDGDARIVGERAGYLLVRALGKIAFAHETFETGAELLMRLAVTENAPYGDDAASTFTELFPLYLGNTAADGRMRLRVLGGMGETDDPRHRAVVIRALDVALKTGHFSRIPGAETHGVRPALTPWQPKTGDEAHDYLEGCLKQLGRLAIREDAQGGEARAALGKRMRGLIGAGMIESVEEIVSTTRDETQWWPEAAESLGRYLKSDAEDGDHAFRPRVEALIDRLQPRDMGAKVRFLVTEMPWDFPIGEALNFEESEAKRIEAIRTLASELVERQEELEMALRQTSGGEQRMAVPFGEALAALDGERGEAQQRFRLAQLVDALERTESTRRNMGVLAGYVRRIGDRNPRMAEKFKREAGRSATLARGLPFLCAVTGITAADVELVVEALQAGRIRSPDIKCWSYGKALHPRSPREVAPLFEALLDKGSEGFGTAVRIMRMYVRGSPEKLQALGAQVCRTARCLHRQIEEQHSTRWNTDFVMLMEEAMHALGPGNAEARATAKTLAHVVAGTAIWLDGSFERRMIGMLLTEFREVTWPIISEAIVSEDGRSREDRWRFVLGARNGVGAGETPLILSIPEAELWAWCRRHPAHAPLFLAGAVPILASESKGERCELHPILIRLVEEVEDPKGVLRRISGNMYDFMWWGSRTSYRERYKEPLDALRDHPNREIRVWAKRTYRNVVERIEEAGKEEEE